MTESPAVETIETAVARAKEHAQRSGVRPEHVDAVAAVMVAMDACMGSTGGGEVVLSRSGEPQFEETFAEWAAAYELQSHVDRFVAIAGYLVEKQGQQSMGTDIAINMYKEARWKPQPQNPADVFSKAAARRFFTASIDSEGKTPLKQWRLTKTGYQHLQSLQKES